MKSSNFMVPIASLFISKRANRNTQNHTKLAYMTDEGQKKPEEGMPDLSFLDRTLSIGRNKKNRKSLSRTLT
jgi:hypothetical protein